jgi:serine/threonine-protein kinase
VAGSVAASGLVAFAITVAAGDRSKDAAEGAPGVQPTTLAGSNKCVVSYAVWSDENNRFKAAVTIANRDTTAIRDWKLWFVMPGDQIVSGNGKLRLDQQGRGVTVQSKSVLRPQATETLQFTGRYQASNAAPMVFELGGQTCQTFVSPAPGAPSQPVEHLTNGVIRLGPVPTEDSPIPGISINPSGVAVPVEISDSPNVGATTPGADRTTPTPTPSASTTPTAPPPSPPSSRTPSSEPTTTATTPDSTTPPPIPSEDPDPVDVDPPGLTG